jgi:hypothetical protein
MEQKPIKQRNMKHSTPKSEPSTEKMVLKAESVVEVKSKKQETPQKTDVVSTKTTKVTKNTKVSEPEPVTVSAPVSAPVTASAPASKSKKTTEKAQVAQVAQVQTAGQSAQTQSAQTQPTKTAKGKQAAVQKATATATAVVAAPVKNTAKTSKKTEGKATATPAAVQAAGAKTKKTVKATKNVTEPVVKASKKVQKVNTDELEENKQLDDKLRYFKLYYNDNICGRYSGKKPKQAANKAFSSIIKDMKKTENKEGVNIDITFTIKECTRNSFHKEYKYVGKRLLLKSPVKVTIENGDGTSKDIVYKYHNELKKAPRT